jgi:putative heme transporter
MSFVRRAGASHDLPRVGDGNADRGEPVHPQPTTTGDVTPAVGRHDHLLPTFEQVTMGAWRLVGLGLAVTFAFLFFLRLRLVMLPLIIALLVSTILAPMAGRLMRHGINRLLATWVVFLSGAGVVAVIALVLVPQTVGQFEQLGRDLERAVLEIEAWLVDGPLNLSEAQVEEYVSTAVDTVSSDTGAIASGLLTGAAVAGEILAGLALTLVLTFFFVKDGDRMAAWALDHVPAHRRPPIRAAASRAWESLAGYLRGTAITGMIDAVLIGIGLMVIGIPLVLPLAMLTFIGAFFPVIGAPLAGLLAVLVALVSGGATDALTVLALVFVVQQLESYLLAPGIMGRAVRLHPVVVLIVLTTGGITAGIIGAFLAVPVTAVSVAVISELRAWQERGMEPGPPLPPVVPPTASSAD